MSAPTLTARTTYVLELDGVVVKVLPSWEATQLRTAIAKAAPGKPSRYTVVTRTGTAQETAGRP